MDVGKMHTDLLAGWLPRKLQHKWIVQHLNATIKSARMQRNHRHQHSKVLEKMLLAYTELMQQIARNRLPNQNHCCASLHRRMVVIFA